MKKLFLALSLLAMSLSYADATPQTQNSTDDSDDVAFRGEGFERDRGDWGGAGAGAPGRGVGAPGRGVEPERDRS